MKKTYIIIGGGISGLALLHFLKKRTEKNPDIRVLLLEKEGSVGGTIRTAQDNGMLFEHGPNGFLGREAKVFDLIDDLGLRSELIQADAGSGKRFIKFQGELHQAPSGPKDILKFSLLTVRERVRLLGDLVLPLRKGSEESVSEFFGRRFGSGFTSKVLDPVLSGIFAGDIKQLHMRSVFPKIWECERTHSSVIRGMMHSMKHAERSSDDHSKTLFSFRLGMGQLIKALRDHHKANIVTDEMVERIKMIGDVWQIDTLRKRYTADRVFVSTPAYAAADMFASSLPDMAHSLEQIPYAPVVVFGFQCSLNMFKKKPAGFGYLIPSSENNPVMGVLHESIVFSGRAADSKFITLRVMLGGMHQKQVIHQTPDQMRADALEEIRSTYGFSGEPKHEGFMIWPKAIPQYTMAYPHLRKSIQQELVEHKGLYICANYMNGVSFNQCVHSAHTVAQSVPLDDVK